MSEAYLMSMPVIINCLGGEMIYILCSRLKAQNITLDKSIRVIKDIGNILFNKKFQSELYIHKKPFKHQEVKAIFENFAHSSIMRLNTTSMNKLFELMLMTLKLQILRTRYPEEIYQITLNHFLGIIEILNSIEAEDKSLLNRVQEEMLNFKQNYSKLSSYDYIILKSVILRFLQGKNVKVSIFIQDNLQDNNSIIYLPMNEESPPFVGKIGIVKNYSNGNEDYFELKLNECFKENTNKNRMDNFNIELGKNMFGKEKLKIIGRPKKEKNNKKPKEKDEKKEEKKDNDNESGSKKEVIDEDLSTQYFGNFNASNEIKDSVFGEDFYNRELTDDQKRIISQGNQRDLKLFTSIFSENTYDNDDLFEFDLFGKDDKNNNEKNNDENCINIERSNNNLKNKVSQNFDNLEQKKEDEDEDDLLDLMDKNV